MLEFLLQKKSDENKIAGNVHYKHGGSLILLFEYKQNLKNW